TVVTNLDDMAWRRLSTERRRVAYSERVTSAEVHSEDVQFSPRGSTWTLVLDRERVHVRLPLIGDFNVINALGAAASAYSLGVPSDRVANRLSSMPQIPGRLEVLRDAPAVLRDYAHTPDALARALDAVRPFVPERLIVVFGCGGDRDRDERQPAHRRSREDSRRDRNRHAPRPRTHRGSPRGHRPRSGDRVIPRRRPARRQRARDLSGSRHDQASVRRKGDRRRAVGWRGWSIAMSTAPPAVAASTFWTVDRVADALAGLSPVNLPRGSKTFGRVWTDTRTIEPGDLFVALAGERFDAHDFLDDAVAKGASGLVVSRVERARGLGVPVCQVRDTLVALGALGTYRRRVWGRPVVAVVGTNGKTSTKELVRAALGSRLAVHATT